MVSIVGAAIQAVRIKTDLVAYHTRRTVCVFKSKFQSLVVRTFTLKEALFNGQDITGKNAGIHFNLLALIR